MSGPNHNQADPPREAYVGEVGSVGRTPFTNLTNIRRGPSSGGVIPRGDHPSFWSALRHGSPSEQMGAGLLTFVVAYVALLAVALAVVLIALVSR